MSGGVGLQTVIQNIRLSMRADWDAESLRQGEVRVCRMALDAFQGFVWCIKLVYVCMYVCTCVCACVRGYVCEQVCGCVPVKLQERERESVCWHCKMALCGDRAGKPELLLFHQCPIIRNKCNPLQSTVICVCRKDFVLHCSSKSPQVQALPCYTHTHTHTCTPCCIYWSGSVIR